MAIITEKLCGEEVHHRIQGPITVTKHIEPVADQDGNVIGEREIALVSPGCDETGDDTFVRQQIQKLHGVPVIRIISDEDGTVNSEPNTKILPDSVTMTIIVMNFRFLLPEYTRIPAKLMTVTA